MTNPILERIQSPGPKKILACDGGGILGLMSVEILARLEQELRARTGKPELVLADYFDFVCGTSTGAIIAAFLSWGLSVDEIVDIYRTNAVTRHVLVRDRGRHSSIVTMSPTWNSPFSSWAWYLRERVITLPYRG
jgi:patatin-like phospholipase/acyl hydrolase